MLLQLAPGRDVDDGPNRAQRDVPAVDLVPVGTGVHLDPTLVSTAVYQLTMKHSGKAIAVDNGSMLDGAVIEQGTSDDRFHWYITPIGAGHQFINRRSGKCMSLSSDAATSGLSAPRAPTADGPIIGSSTSRRFWRESRTASSSTR